MFLVGEDVSLRSLELSDLEQFWEWFADRTATKYSLSEYIFPQSRNEVQEWLERSIRDKRALHLGIVERATNTLIGNAGIAAISQINRSGEYFIFIGDKQCWGKGYGTEVTKLIVDYGFANLNLHRINLTVSAENVGGVKAYTKAGFVQEGILREASYRDGHFHDKIAMAILRCEWETLHTPTMQ